MIKGNRYKCFYTSGGGTEYDEGEWEIKTLTDKTMIIEKITESGIYGTYEKGETIKCGKKSQNPIERWDDGTFTIYPLQAGTPYYFEEVKK